MSDARRWSTATRSLAWCLLAALCFAVPARGQEPRGLTFVIGLGYEEGGPGPALTDALAEADLADVKPERCVLTTCVDAVEHPVHFSEGLNLAAFFGGRYRFDAPLSLELLASNGQRGHAEGYNDETKEDLVVAYASFLLSATLGVHVGPVRLETGPVLKQTYWNVTRSGRDLGRRGIPAFGALLGASGSVRVADVFLSVRAGLRRFPTTDLRSRFNVPIEADYRSFLVGVTVLPASN